LLAGLVPIEEIYMKRRCLWTAFVIAVILSGAALAQSEIDPEFGKRILNAGHAGYAQDMVVQPDNKVVMVSGCFHFEDGSYTVCMVRVNPNGTLDGSFVGSENRVPGIVRTKSLGVCNCSGEMFGIARQIDGKLVVAGVVTQTGVGQGLGLSRYNVDGSIDTSFGTNGSVFTNISPENDHGRKVAIQPDGKIVVVGYSITGEQPYPTAQQFLARYTSGGVLDSSFGTGGIFKANLPGSRTHGESIAIQTDGKILAGGAAVGPEQGYLITRLNPDGTLDTSWSGDGYRIIANSVSGIYTDSGIRSLTVQSDGRITALGTLNHIFRLNPDGAFDTTFAGVGFRAALPDSYTSENAYGMIVTAGGRITVVGQSRPPGLGYQYEVARFLSNGAEDTSFSGDGYLSIDIGAGNDGGRSIAVDSQGRLVVAGINAIQSCSLCNPWVPSSFSVTRLIVPTVLIGISGRATRPDGQPVINAILTTLDNTGTVRFARTNPFGYYRFLNLPPAQSYTISVRAKGRLFADRTVVAGDDVANVDFISQEP